MKNAFSRHVKIPSEDFYSLSLVDYFAFGKNLLIHIASGLLKALFRKLTIHILFWFDPRRLLT